MKSKQVVSMVLFGVFVSLILGPQYISAQQYLKVKSIRVEMFIEKGGAVERPTEGEYFNNIKVKVDAVNENIGTLVLESKGSITYGYYSDVTKTWQTKSIPIINVKSWVGNIAKIGDDKYVTLVSLTLRDGRVINNIYLEGYLSFFTTDSADPITGEAKFIAYSSISIGPIPGMLWGGVMQIEIDD